MRGELHLPSAHVCTKLDRHTGEERQKRGGRTSSSLLSVRSLRIGLKRSAMKNEHVASISDISMDLSIFETCLHIDTCSGFSFSFLNVGENMD